MGNSINENMLRAAIGEDLCISPYDPSWPQKFLTEKARLLGVFSSDIIEIEHIGSTAVPGLDAKPIIDMMASVKSMNVADKLLAPLREFCYVTPSDCNDTLPERRWLMRHLNGHRTHHLHLIKVGSFGWKRTIKFRDFLREKPAIARAYKELKLKLIRATGNDRDKYVQGKTEFIENLLKEFGL